MADRKLEEEGTRKVHVQINVCVQGMILLFIYLFIYLAF